MPKGRRFGLTSRLQTSKVLFKPCSNLQSLRTRRQATHPQVQTLKPRRATTTAIDPMIVKSGLGSTVSLPSPVQREESTKALSSSGYSSRERDKSDLFGTPVGANTSQIKDSASHYYRKKMKWDKKSGSMKVIHAISRQRKVKTFLPKAPSKTNLGKSFAGVKLSCIEEKFHPIIRKLRVICLSKTDLSMAVLKTLQEMLLGVTFKSEWIYTTCANYLRYTGHYCMIQKNPPFSQVQLLIQQIANVSSDFPWEIFYRVFNSLVQSDTSSNYVSNLSILTDRKVYTGAKSPIYNKQARTAHMSR